MPNSDVKSDGCDGSDPWNICTRGEFGRPGGRRSPAQPASANDTARLLAGMQPSPDSPLLALTKEQAWQQYAKRFDAIFANIESRQLTRIRAWSQAKLTSPSPVLFYMFSGPDSLCNAFFPNASTS